MRLMFGQIIPFKQYNYAIESLVIRILGKQCKMGQFSIKYNSQ
jgi:hypothetical protein